MEWQPTPELRFVERGIPCGDHIVQMTRILQQKWKTVDPYSGVPVLEWRDVPLVEDKT